MLIHLLKRIILVFSGYCLATLASGMFVGGVFHMAEDDGSMTMPGIMALAVFMIGIYAALPALVFVLVGEGIRIRARLYYVAAACLIGMALPAFVGLEHWYILVGLGFGPAAGLLYWYTAGRGAGWSRNLPQQL